MLQDFMFALPTQFFFGHGAEMKAPEILSQKGAKNLLLLHYGAGRDMSEEKFVALKTAFEEKGIKTFEFTGVKPNPVIDLISEAKEYCLENKIDFILAIGGGSVIDTAKTLAVACKYDGDPWDIFDGKHFAVEGLPLAIVLTYPATGSEGGPIAMMGNEKYELKMGAFSPAFFPTVVFEDPELTVTLPKKLTACGVTDMFTHVLERYFTTDCRFGVIDEMAEGIMRTLIEKGPYVLEHPDDYDARSEIMWIGTIAHNDTVGVGRQQDWGSHLCCHPISAVFDTPHGITLSIVNPAWMKHVYKACPKRFVRYATKVFGICQEGKSEEELVLAGIKATEDFYKSLGMPTSFTEAGIPTDQMEHLADLACTPGAGQSHFVELTRDDILAIYELAK